MCPTGARKFTETPAFQKSARRPATPQSGGGDTTSRAGTIEDNNPATARRPVRRITVAPVGRTRAQPDHFNDPCNYLG